MNYQSVFVEILREGLAAKPFEYLRRTTHHRVLPRKAIVFKGVRRSGKSTLMQQIADDESNSGRPCLMMNFFDERLTGMNVSHLREMFDAYHEVYNDVRPDGPLSLFLDELQLVDGWEAFVERQLRITDRRVYITGSSAKLLSTEIASTMRGRSLSYEVFPFSFKEYLLFRNVDISPAKRTAEGKAALKAQFQIYLWEGGFPETVNCERQTQVKILQEYFEVMLLRDIIERHNATNAQLVKRCMLMLLSQFASSYTLNKTMEKLRTQGLTVSKAQMSSMIEWFADGYAMFSVQIFSDSIHRQNTNPKKIYAVDNGFVNALHSRQNISSGRLLENAVFLFLRRNHQNIFYYKTQDGYEVDFLIPEQGLTQVCWTLEDAETRRREVRALESAMDELGLNNSMILTYDECEDIVTNTGVIKVKPAWDFFLD